MLLQWANCCVLIALFEVEAKTTRTFTRSQRVSSLSEHNKSALTDHAAQENHNDQLVQSYGDRQGAGAIFQVDQRGSKYPQGRPTRYESRRGQLSTQSRLWPPSRHGIVQSCQEPEELSTSFFWWRPLIEVETSILGINLVVFDELFICNNFPT